VANISDIKVFSETGIGAFTMQKKEIIAKENAEALLASYIKDEKTFAKIFKSIGKLGRGLSPFNELSNYKNYKEFLKALRSGKITPSTTLLIVVASCLVIEGEKHAANAEKLTEILRNYTSHDRTENPTQPSGIYIISTISGSAGTGGAGVYYTDSYYDITTKKFLGGLSGN
jgi:hypothetical protein